ncbi:hypothetical protein AC1031_002770 [Aphanomyces cochlioides]|nr:hypothetical protein AC1031_002770 [Aphanomyces cochlioides]
MPPRLELDEKWHSYSRSYLPPLLQETSADSPRATSFEFDQETLFTEENFSGYSRIDSEADTAYSATSPSTIVLGSVLTELMLDDDLSESDLSTPSTAGQTDTKPQVPPENAPFGSFVVRR